MKRLVVVESPTKARTIRRFLPADLYQVEACMGHVRDLPSSAAEIPAKEKGKSWSRLGVNVDNNFEPLYIIPKGKKKVVSELKRALKTADELYIATDEDREGESIGWHLLQVLAPDVPVRRMVFHEITRAAIEEALENTRQIDERLVESQETRRILDRLVGYEISPLLWRKIAPRLSAGRVQSAAVRMLVIREKDRIAFTTASFWGLNAELRHDGVSFQAKATHLNDERLAIGKDFLDETGRLSPDADARILDEQSARSAAEAFANGSWTVTSVEEQPSVRRPYPPFITSTLQQEANRKLGWSARDTMRVAQNLYERGHITYMRTDSTQLSNEALTATRGAIQSRYGDTYLSPSPRQFSGRPRNAQEAHEAIRPAGTGMRTADELNLSGREAALYDLVWKRTLASQMADARLRFTTVQMRAEGADGSVGQFRASGKQVVFPGFFRAYVEGSDDPDAALENQESPLPDMADGDRPDCRRVDPESHETKPPARFTDASLVRELEKLGIGRPSTYASIIGTIIERGYARRKGKQLVPTFTAFATNNLLETQFEHLVDFDFTARMEQALDDIAEGKTDARPYLRSFYSDDDGLKKLIEAGLDSIDPRIVSTVAFPAWKPYVVRVGKFGPYTELESNGEKATASLPEDVAPDELSPEYLNRLLESKQAEDTVVVVDPETSLPIYIKDGRFGPYLQLGEVVEGEETPKRVSIPKGMDPSNIDAETAIALISLPRRLGVHPDSGEPIEAGIGRYGPYVKHERTFASLPKTLDVLTVTLADALPLLTAKANRKAPGKEVGKHPDSGEPIMLLSGRYGPYLKHQKVNASLPKDLSPDDITLERAVELVDAKAAAPKRGRRRK